MKDLIKKLDGAELFLRNIANAKTAPLNGYTKEILIDTSELICEAIGELEKLTSLNNELEAKFNTCSKRFYKEGINEFAERLKDNTIPVQIGKKVYSVVTKDGIDYYLKKWWVRLMDKQREKLIDEVKFAYDENCILYMLEATGSEAQHISELLQAENEGRLLVLPCMVGDIVYCIIEKLDHEEESFISEETITEVGSKGFWLSAFNPAKDDMSNFEKWEVIGKTVFFTKEDAEKALKGVE